MARPRRETTLCTALRVLDLRYMIRRDPAPLDIHQYLGLPLHHAHRWAAAVKRLSDIRREEDAA